ncbi:MAG: hypothetical protein ACRDGT_04470 [Candidatus Limnocylindria bacterium]
MAAEQEDQELRAMVAVRDALAPLDDPARTRVIRWAADRFKVVAAATSSPAVPSRATPAAPEASNRPMADLAAFYHAASPKTDTEKVLTVAYWLQKSQGLTDVESFGVNSELKQLGFGVGNVTRAFDNLMAMRPQPVMQTRKSGTSKQGRKKFRVTDIGMRTVERMLQGQPSDLGEDDAAAGGGR